MTAQRMAAVSTIKMLEAQQPEMEKVLEAQKNLAEAKKLISLKTRFGALLEMSKYVTFAQDSMMGNTLAVMALDGGEVVMNINPDFFNEDLETVQYRAFAVMHENLHIVYGHVQQERPTSQREARARVLVEEAYINNSVHELLNGVKIASSARHLDMPPNLIHPYELWEHYSQKKDPKLGKPVPFETFMSNDKLALRELLLLTDEDEPKVAVCGHSSQGSPDDSDTDGDGGNGADGSGQHGNSGAGSGTCAPSGNAGSAGSSQTDGGDDSGNAQRPGTGFPGEGDFSEILDKVFGELTKQAANGDEEAKAEIEKIMASADPTDKSGWKGWGSGSATGFRGGTKRTVNTFWEDLTASWIDKVTAPGDEPEYDPLTEYVPELNDRLLCSDDSTTSTLLVAIDTTGSMDLAAIRAIKKMVAHSEEITVKYVYFQTAVVEFEPGDDLLGGGGTDFECVNQYVNNMEEPPEGVLMYTDGFASSIYPEDPDKWFWLITPDGTTEVPETPGTEMEFYKLTLDDMNAMLGC